MRNFLATSDQFVFLIPRDVIVLGRLYCCNANPGQRNGEREIKLLVSGGIHPFPFVIQAPWGRSPKPRPGVATSGPHGEGPVSREPSQGEYPVILRILIICSLAGWSAKALGWDNSQITLDIEYKRADTDASPEEVLQSRDGWIRAEDRIFQIDATSGAWWIRLTPDPETAVLPADGDQAFRLGVYVIHLDKVTYFSWLNGKRDRQERFGDRVPVHARPVRDLVPVFPQLWNPKTEKLSMLLRIESRYIPVMDIQLRTRESYENVNLDVKILMGAFLGILVIMALYHMVVYVISRTDVYFYYSMVVLSYLMLYLSVSGIGSIYLWPEQLWFQSYSPLLGTIMLNLAIVGFLRHFLKDFFPPWYRYVALSLVVLFIALGLVVMVVRNESKVLHYYGYVQVAAIIFCMYCLIRSLRHSMEVRLISLGFLASFAGLSLFMAGYVGIVTSAITRLSVYVIGNVVELALFAVAMASHLKNLYEQRERIMRSVSGLVSQNVLSRITDNPRLIPKGVNEVNVTVMFVDIVGFSRTFDSCHTEDIFRELRRTFHSVSTIVQRYGGTVDRSLGDGVLCFFGYDLAGSRTEEHADQAMNAAIAIQEQSVQRVVGNSRSLAVFPLRIGINTTDVKLGNIGSGDRFDFTIIGKGVNLASRLEASCSPHKIVISDSTRSALRQEYPRSFSAIRVRIKHQEGFFQAWEFNQFSDQNELLQKSDRIFWLSRKYDSNEPRFAPALNEGYRLRFVDEDFIVCNYSESGLAADGMHLYGRGAQLNVRILTTDGKLEEELGAWYLHQITVEVCWSRRMRGVFRHGFKIIGNNPEQRHRIFTACRNILESEIIPKQGSNDLLKKPA